MDESKMPLVSVRLPRADLEKLGVLAKRLRVRDSDIIRCALRQTFARLAPLLDEQARGADLMPVFLAYGAELCRDLDLDPQTLDAIINGALGTPRKRVDCEDIELMATLHLYDYRRGVARPAPEPPDRGDARRRYLYEKYVASQQRFLGQEQMHGSFLQVPG
jgi:hypothetical protein